jgi:hypothetical protein
MSASRVLAALIRVHARDGRATIRAVADAAGMEKGWVHHRLQELAGEGLVASEPGLTGTLRPLVAPIPEPAACPRLTDGTVDVRELCRLLDDDYNRQLPGGAS